MPKLLIISSVDMFQSHRLACKWCR